MVKVLVFVLVISIWTFAYGQPAPRRHRHSHHSRHRSRIHMSTVEFPSGNTHEITIPVEGTQWQCGRNATLIELSPTGRMGSKEYNIVKTEIENTNVGLINFNIIKVEKVKNSCAWQRYKYWQRQIVKENRHENEKMLFHGSTVAGQLVHTGFDERYARVGLFGSGVYFADRSSKSHGYTGSPADGARRMLLCRVSLGKMYITRSGSPYPHAPVGYHSVKGDISPAEYVVYRGEQAYPEYLITYTS